MGVTRLVWIRNENIRGTAHVDVLGRKSERPDFDDLDIVGIEEGW